MSSLGKAHDFTPFMRDYRDIQEDSAKAELADALAREVLLLSRNTLLIHLSFMDTALVQFTMTRKDTIGGIATNGKHLLYNPLYVLRGYKAARENPVRDYLHIVLHCVFRHPFSVADMKTAAWDLACDIAVESIITDMGLKSAAAPREKRQGEMLAKLREELSPLTAERLYRYFLDQDKESLEDYNRLRAMFYADDHNLWYEEALKDAASNGDSGDSKDGSESESGTVSGGEGNSQEETAPPESGEEEEGGGGRADDEKGVGSGRKAPGEKEAESLEEQPVPDKDELEKLWKDISERIQVDLETSPHRWGEGSGDMMQQLKAVNREKYDYAGFLRRFSTLGENIEINDDEFDYILYTYGLGLFGNMPLIEPLEYKEVRRIREFVIALDTSQSVSGELVQTFVNKTYNILKQSESFFMRINVHIIQCGAAIQEDRKITSQEDFDNYIKTMKLFGFGGTDFRPVFSYVDELIDSHEFTNFKGLIYFTDGFGEYPQYRPDYDTAFVFCTDIAETPEVPVWAIKLVLSPEELMTPSPPSLRA